MIKGKEVYFTTSVVIVLFIIIAGCVSMQPRATFRPVSVVSVESGCARIGLQNMIVIKSGTFNLPNSTDVTDRIEHIKLLDEATRKLVMELNKSNGEWIRVGCQNRTCTYEVVKESNVPSVPSGFEDNGCNPAGPAFTLTLNASSTNVPVTQISGTVILIKDFLFGATFRTPLKFTFSDINQSNPLMPGKTASETSDAIVGPVDVSNTNGYTSVLIEGELQNGQSFSYWTKGNIS